MNNLFILNFDKYKYGNFHIEFSNDFLCISGHWGVLKKKVSMFLFKDNNIYMSHIFFKLFIILLRDSIVGVCSRWFIELEMKGLGFKTFYSVIEQMYKVDLGYNHYIYYPLKSSSLLSIKTKKRSKFIIVFGIDKLQVWNLVYKILAFRKVTSYKFRGIKFKNKSLALKVGKKKQFF